MGGYFGGVVLLDEVSPGGEVVLGGGRAEPLVVDGGLGVVSALGLGAGVVAEAFAPEVIAALLDATDVPDHQSFFARCDGEAFR
jgi:hypothetical protein